MAVHRLKVQAHRALRWVRDRRSPIPRAQVGAVLRGGALLAEVKSLLWNTEVEPREWPLELGKVENLRVAVRSLDGLELAAGQVFSFWRQVGPPLRVRGFVEGRELREGCIVPGIAGGLCLLSNALYAASLHAGLRVVERHAHSRKPPGSRAALGEDATVAWNYLDLRVVGDARWRLEACFDARHLVVRIRSDSQTELLRRRAPARASHTAAWAAASGPSCMSCDRTCAHARPATPSRSRSRERRTWLLDAAMPEHVEYLRTQGRAGDRLMQPVDGEWLGIARYAWPHIEGARVRQFPVCTAVRSVRSRQLADQGAERQRALLVEDRRLAAAMTAALSPHDTEVIVAQSLLPHLARLGALGGRRVRVLMQRLPLAQLQSRLDAAHARHPASTTLGDFRADAELVDAEARALADAFELVTPHADIARCYPEKTTLLDWKLPQSERRVVAAPHETRVRGGLRLWWPSGTVGRKGAWELRDALSQLGPCELWIAGRELEGPQFWSALPQLELHRGTPPVLTAVDAVVLPAWVEHQPRALLHAIAQGIPVVATTACGLHGFEDVHVIETGDSAALCDVLARCR